MNPRMHPSRRQSVTDDFERETKLVVLNFMGLVPASCPATAEVCDAMRVDVSSDDEDAPQRSHSALPYGNCDLQPVRELPGEETCSMVNRSLQNGGLTDKHDDAAGVVINTCTEDRYGILYKTTSNEKLHMDSHMQSTSIASSADHQILRPSRNSESQPQSALLQPPLMPASSRTPSPCDASSPALLERQSSSRSTTSSRSRLSATRTASINVQLADLETLVKSNALPPLVIPLRDEISHEMEVLGQEHHDGDDAQGVFSLNFHYS